MKGYEREIVRKRQVKTQLISMYGNFCYYCNKTMSPFLLTIDHIYPVAKRTSYKNNYHKKAVFLRTLSKDKCVLACQECNLLKGDRVISIEAFRKEQMGQMYFPVECVQTKKEKVAQKRAENKAKNVWAKNPVLFKEIVIVKRASRFVFFKNMCYNIMGMLKVRLWEKTPRPPKNEVSITSISTLKTTIDLS